MDGALSLIGQVLPQATGTARKIAGLSDDTVEVCMIAAALELAAKQLRPALMDAHFREGKPLGRRVTLADWPTIKLVMQRDPIDP